MPKKRSRQPAGVVAPRGGETTVTKAGMHRKTVYFDKAEWEAIRRRAFEENRRYTDIVRGAVRRALKLPPSSTD